MRNFVVPGPIRTRALVRGRLALATVLAVSILGSLAGSDAALADDPTVTAAPAGAAASVVVVRKGDRGPAVRRIQRRLRISADGVFGKGTRRAVRRFQRRRGLTSDGIVGPITRRALRLPPFSRGSVVHTGGGAPGPGGVRMPAVMLRIAECESGGNPRAVSPDGQYRGKWQFSRGTWKDYGGRGSDPAEASERHQDRIALRLYRARGTDPWPACSRR